MDEIFFISVIFAVVFIFIVIVCLIGKSVKTVTEYKRLIVFRFGKYRRTVGPGIVFILPLIEVSEEVDLRIKTLDIARQEIITKDNIPITIDTSVFYKVINPEYAKTKIENFMRAVLNYTQGALRDVIGNMELDEVLTQRERISSEIRKVVDEETREWGVQITQIKIQQIELPENMKRAMAVQAEKEREKRASIIASEGELEASKNIAEAGRILSETPSAIQLRTLQTIQDISQEPSQKIVIFLPTDLGKLLDKLK
ncbi:MAG: slipin family protein [Candidatus Lokiarchaeota archaeon]|jgi:regulator of protease activity HflC (stomatin/prohibitin superfamily)|nr:slipin family protein [Candidatus Lokiarchaeota archaeon]